jgi:syntaxin 5
MTSTQDRTNEFKACVDSIRNRSALDTRNSEAKQRLLQSNAKPPGKGEFSHMALSIGKDISSTTVKLNKLAQRASVLSRRLALTFNTFNSGKTKDTL